MPFWNTVGDASIGAFSDGSAIFYCVTPVTNCEDVTWPYTFSAYNRQGGSLVSNWQGTLLQGGRDKSGLDFKRNRSYDPQTGRFTQEDPIGLAGGLNLYGFANGDPVNFSDPFGLRVRLAYDPEGKIQQALAALVGGSEIFHEMFKALHLAPSSQADISVFACGLSSSPASCGSLWFDRGGGAYTARAPGNQRIDVNGTLSGDDLLDRLTEEFVHAAIANRAKVKTGISCHQNEDNEACADRWLETIRQQRKADDEAKKKENNQ